jgi:hypothetical protein
MGDSTATSLGTICVLTKGTYPTEKTPPGPYPLIVTAEFPRTSDSFQLDGEAVCIPIVSSTGHGHASLKRVHYVHGRFAVANLLVAAQPRPGAPVDARWLWLYLNHYKDSLIVPLMRGTANVSLKPAQLADIAIDLPPLTEQRRIVDLIDAVDMAKRGEGLARQSELSWRAVIGDVTSDAREWTPLSELVVRARAGGTPARRERAFYGGDIPWLKSGEVDSPRIYTTTESLTDRGLAASSAWLMPVGAIVVAMYGQGLTAGSVGFLEAPMASNQAVLGLVPDAERVHPRFLFHWLRSRKDAMRGRRSGSTQPNLNKELVLKEDVPILDPATQRSIANALDALLDVVDVARHQDASLGRLRATLLSDLLSGRHEISDSYDRFLDPAA